MLRRAILFLVLAASLVTGVACRVQTPTVVMTSPTAVIAPTIGEYCIFCHRSVEPGHLAQLADLKADPLIDLGLRLGEGTGAALAWPVVKASVAFLNEMASFESAGVSEQR